MENRIENRQISLKNIIEIANYMEECKNSYVNIFKKEEIENKDLPNNQKKYEYANGNAKMNYTIEFYSGQTKTESDYNWFIKNLSEPILIKNIGINLYIEFLTKSLESNYNDILNNIDVLVDGPFECDKRDLSLAFRGGNNQRIINE